LYARRQEERASQYTFAVQVRILRQEHHPQLDGRMSWSLSFSFASNGLDEYFWIMERVGLNLLSVDVFWNSRSLPLFIKSQLPSFVHMDVLYGKD